MKALKYGAFAPFLVAALALASTASAQQAEPKIAGTEVTKREIPGTQSGPQAALAAVSVAEPVRPTEVIKGDHIAAGVALRNRGGGVINLRGAPPKATPIAAFLYWDILADQAERSAIVSVNGAPVEASVIGKGASPCWSPGANFAYRAKVPLNLLYIGINGDYKIAGIPSSEGFGMDPWQSSTGPIMAEGANSCRLLSGREQPLQGDLCLRSADLRPDVQHRLRGDADRVQRLTRHREVHPRGR